MIGHGHRIEQCKHGTVVMQCRCANKEKPIYIVPCPEQCPEHFSRVNAEIIVMLEIQPGTHIGFATTEDGIIKVFDTMVEAEDAMRGHIAEDYAVYLPLPALRAMELCPQCGTAVQSVSGHQTNRLGAREDVDVTFCPTCGWTD